MKPEKMEMKPAHSPIKFFVRRDSINDVGIRVVLVPLFGIAIPLITQMVPHEQFTNWQIKFSYLYTILIAFVIYEGTRFLHFTLRTYFDWINRPVQKAAAMIITIPFYCVPVSVLMLVGWYLIFMHGVINWDVLRLTVIIILVAVFFLVNLYEIVFLVRDAANDRVNQEQLERAKAEAELGALKSQVDPHFIFNSLNTLSHLIETHPGKALQFNNHLADVYRYILHNKSRDLVMLHEEIAFLEDYFSLLAIRFEHAVELYNTIDASLYDQYMIPPISLQLLAENAIKHNDFSNTAPMRIKLGLSGDMLVVSNPVNPKQRHKASSKIGLHNLNERYRLVTGKEIRVNATRQRFDVQLPVLKI